MKKEEERRQERVKANKVSGREMFQQEGFEAVDDDTAEDTYEREIDVDEEIRKAEAEARKREAEIRAMGGEAGPDDPVDAGQPGKLLRGDLGAAPPRGGAMPTRFVRPVLRLQAPAAAAPRSSCLPRRRKSCSMATKTTTRA